MPNIQEKIKSTLVNPVYDGEGKLAGFEADTHFISETEEARRKNREIHADRATMATAGEQNFLGRMWHGLTERYQQLVTRDRFRRIHDNNENITLNAAFNVERQAVEDLKVREAEEAGSLAVATRFTEGTVYRDNLTLLDEETQADLGREIPDMARSAIAEFTVGNIDDAQLSVEVNNIATRLRTEFPGLFSRSTIGSDLMLVAEASRDAYLSHEDRLSTIDIDLSFYLGAAGGAFHTQERRDLADRLIDWAQNSRVKSVLINPLTIGIGSSLGAVALRVPTKAIPFIGGFAGGVFAAIRRASKENKDRHLKTREEEIGYEMNGPGPHRGGVERALSWAVGRTDFRDYSYQPISALEQTETLDVLAAAGDATKLTNAWRDDVLAIVAETRVRLNLSEYTERGLIQFGQERESDGTLRVSGVSTINRDKANLIGSMIAAQRVLIDEIGQIEFDRLFSEETARISANLSDQIRQADRNFSGNRTVQALRTGLFAFGVGVAGGFATGWLGDRIEHLFERTTHSEVSLGQSHTETIINAAGNNQGLQVDVPEGFTQHYDAINHVLKIENADGRHFDIPYQTGMTTDQIHQSLAATGLVGDIRMVDDHIDLPTHSIQSDILRPDWQKAHGLTEVSGRNYGITFGHAQYLAPGHHEYNELTLYQNTGVDWSIGPRGLDGYAIPPFVYKQYGSYADPALVFNAPVNSENLVGFVQFIDEGTGIRHTLLLDQTNGHFRLPDEFVNPTTGKVDAIEAIGYGMVRDANGKLVSDEILKNPDLINGGTLHSMASIRLPQVSRMIPGESIEIKFDKISDLHEVVDIQHHIGLPPIATPFAPRIFPRIAEVPPVIYSEYPDHINYRDSVPYSDHVDRVVKIVDGSILPEKVSSEKRAIVESARTSDKELAARLAAEEDYLKTVGDKYRLDSSDPEVMAMLYRLNGATKNYLDELREVNASLPPMSEKAKMTVVIPAFNEEAKIEKTLRTWVNQREIVDGKPMDPQLIEFIILVNRPSSDVAFDRTAQVVKELLEKPEFANFNVHLVTKTFNFPSAETTVNLNGKPVKIAGRKRMGLIYKYGADLALLRNLSREDNLRKANHLLRTGGADVLGRNPEFASRVFAWFDNDPGLEQYVSRADFPPAIYEKLPLLHVANRLHEMMNVQMTQKRSNIGLGTYRMGIYAQAGGFNSGIDVREEIDLSRRIRTIIDRREARGGVARKRDTILNALDDPRRSIAVILAGKPITQAYDTWVNDAIRKVNIEDVGKNLPGEAKLNRANVQAQAQAIFQFYFKQILESPIFSGLSKEKKVRRAYNLTANYLKHSFSALGINNYEYGYKGNLVVDSTKRPAEIAQNAFVSIKDINNLQRLVGKYPSRPRPDWVDGSKTRGSYNRDYKMGSAADGSTYRAPVRTTDLARRVSRPISGSTPGLLEGQREHLERIRQEAESLRQRGLRQVREQLARLNRDRAEGRSLTREDASSRLRDLRKGIDRDFREVSNVIGNDILSINHRIRNRIRELENQKSNETGMHYRFNGDIRYNPSFKRVNAFRAVTDEEFEQIWKDYDFKVGLKPVGESRIFGGHDRSEELRRISAQRQVLQTKLGR